MKSEKMELRPYQREAIEIIDQLPPGAYLAQMATGLGKTVTFANIPRRGRVLLLSHREELVRQPAKYYDCTFGIEQSQNHANGEEVVSASVMSLTRRLGRFDPYEFDMIICDEAHHAAAKTYRRIFNYFRPRMLLGLPLHPTAAIRSGWTTYSPRSSSNAICAGAFRTAICVTSCARGSRLDMI